MKDRAQTGGQGGEIDLDEVAKLIESLERDLAKVKDGSGDLQPLRDEVEAAMRDFRSPIDELALPTAPRPAIFVERDIQRPQPRLDRDRGNGMAVVVGPVSPCAVLDYKFRVCSHNTIRGAAGAAILNAELLYKKGMIG